MGSYKNSHISATIGARGALKASFDQMREWDCTVTFGDIERGIFETTYSNVEITGPDWAISRFHRWVSDQMGVLV